MRRNKGKIFTKIQDVMGIKNGKYCSSDVSVVSINGGGGSVAVPAFKVEAQKQLITYIDCPKRETVTIDFGEIQMNNNIIPDCVLGGSVILNDLGGYVVNYGDTICPVIIPNVKQIQRCVGFYSSISIDFGNYVVTDGKVYDLSFNGKTQPGCYTIIGDSPFVDSQESVSSVKEVYDCNSCGPTPQTVIQIQSCENGLTYNVIGDFPFIKFGDILNLTFKKNIIDNGCYTILGTTLSTPLDVISSILGKYESCMSCLNPTPTPTFPTPTFPTPTFPTPTFSPPKPPNIFIQSCKDGEIYSVANNIYSYSAGTVLNLTFKYGSIPEGCYTILGPTTNQPTDTISSSPNTYSDCNSCLNPTPSPTFVSPTPTPTIEPPQLYLQIQSCNDESIYSVSSNVELNKGGASYYNFENGSVPDGCYTTIGSTTDLPEDIITSSSDSYSDCNTCLNPPQ